MGGGRDGGSMDNSWLEEWMDNSWMEGWMGVCIGMDGMREGGIIDG